MILYVIHRHIDNKKDFNNIALLNKKFIIALKVPQNIRTKIYNNCHKSSLKRFTKKSKIKIKFQ